ncbi:MAG: tetratricopeptide repeat protein, partial [Myxococcota bacterium]|nr:tetratricopeptide repeat protein [Myxococcota bacterium]
AVEQLLTRHPRDGALLASLGHLLAQAEEDRDARATFTRALRADDDSYEALLGRAGVEIRRGDLGGAARSIDGAERAARQRGASSAFFARVSVARARLRFEVGDFDEARRLAEAAIAADPKCAEAHVVLANIAIERNGDPVPHFRAAIAGTRVPPEALGRLAIRVGGSEGCTLGRAYVAAAPEGYDREDVDREMRRCR